MQPRVNKTGSEHGRQLERACARPGPPGPQLHTRPGAWPFVHVSIFSSQAGKYRQFGMNRDLELAPQMCLTFRLQARCRYRQRLCGAMVTVRALL